MYENQKEESQQNDPYQWSDGCLFDEEGTRYEDNEGSDYPVNPYDEDGTIDE